MIIIIAAAVLIILTFTCALIYVEMHLNCSSNHRAKKIAQDIYQSQKKYLAIHKEILSTLPEYYQNAFRFARSINGFPVSRGNRAELLGDSTTAWQRLVDDIHTARASVYVLYYIWLADKTGHKLAHALIRAAKRGVQCCVMVDGVGSRQLVKSALWAKMQAAGVKLGVALPFTFKNVIHSLLFSRVDLRNHRKITIIDGRISYCGSQNCADATFLAKRKYAPWVDVMLRVEGPCAEQNQLLFANDWLSQDNRQSLAHFQVSKAITPKGESIAQVIGSGPSECQSSTSQFLITLIHQAQQSLTITTPYFVPSKTVSEALCSVALRGIAVNMIFPQHNDSWVVAAASRSYYFSMLQAGVRIHEFSEGLLHTKTLVVDNSIAFVGSSNMDKRSLDLNYENNMLFYDKKLAQDIFAHQQDYLQKSTEITIADVLKWPYIKTIGYKLAATMGSVL